MRRLDTDDLRVTCPGERAGGPAGTSHAPVVVLEGVGVSLRGRSILRGVDLAMAPGTVTCILGANGAGKTTTMRVCVGLQHASEGRVRWSSGPVRAASSRIGYAAQDVGLYLPLRVRQNLEFFGRLNGVPSRLLTERIEWVADRLELGDCMNARVQHLSGGVQRRVHFAAAVLHMPPFVALDEVTTGVDVLTRTRVVGLVRELADMGIAVVYSTHLLDELADLGDPDVVFLRDGDVVSQGSVSGLVARLGLKTRIEVDYGGGDATHGARRETIEADQPDAVLEALLGRAREAGESITRIQTFGPSASTVFHALHEMAADDAR